MKYRRFFVALVLMVTAFLCVHYFLGFEDEPPNKPQTKQESFDPPLMENSCRFPLVEPLERNIHEYVNLFKAVHCGTDMPNLASVDENNVLTIHYELEPWKQSRTPSFRCEYQSLSGGLSPNIMNYVLSEERIEVKPNEPVFVPHDQFVVTCRNTSLVGFLNGIRKVNDSVIYVNTFAGFSRTKQIPTVSADPNKPSLAILVLDSTAHNQFVRHMPKTIEFMQKLGFITLNGYVKVGDNSAVNLLPVLGGRSILPKIGGDGSEVLPEGEVVNLENVDFLFDFMKERKCVTLFNDDILDVRRGLFHYPNETFLGFRRSPADYYFRPFHLYNTRNLVFPINGGQCMKNGDINVERYLDIWERFSLLHKDKCHFSFNFLTGLTHDESSNLGAIDNRLRTSLESLFANDAMKSTAFVIMGDHGNRIGSIQRSYVGRVEERMPMFSIYLPEAFRITHPQYIQNLMFNANRLTSNFDVHATLKQIAMGIFGSEATALRGTSLLTERIPVERTCEQAGVPPNFCVCMDEKPLGRLNRQSTEFTGVRAALKESLTKFPCLNAHRLTIKDDRLQTLVLNQMVRHGLRNASAYDKVKNVQAAMEILFFDVNASVRTFYTQKTVDLRARVKHYVKEFTFEVASFVAVVFSEKLNATTPIDLKLICNTVDT
ncbi:hypothetical protein QR680_002643 [Steinernema hermaphroditum]|uniref:Uncharacterized protein n=1 Tax=Steinernema hermaphroditum TaxID=289476 RepID=A0AA39LII0_9BILA|nr:hypothetical protein QR680_002643 [Steinernema hermaphroditum]